MKKVLTITIFFVLSTNIYSQVIGDDCHEATDICDTVYSLMYLSPIDTLASANEINSLNSCLANGEVKGNWYRFAADGPGYLRFNITPNDTTMDFDWALFKMRWDDTCTNIFSDPSLEIACDFSGIGGGFYTTGMSGVLQQGQQPAYFLSDPAVFYLYITTSLADTADSSGYVIDFTAADFNLTTCSQIGLNETVQTSFDLYPNPTDGLININADKDISKVWIYNLSGQQLIYRKVEGSSLVMNLQSLSPGVYFMELLTEHGILRRKIIRR